MIADRTLLVQVWVSSWALVQGWALGPLVFRSESARVLGWASALVGVRLCDIDDVQLLRHPHYNLWRYLW